MSDLSRKVFLAEVAAVNEHLAEQQPTTDHTPPADTLVGEARSAVYEALAALPARDAGRLRSLISELEGAVESAALMRRADRTPPADQTADACVCRDNPVWTAQIGYPVRCPHCPPGASAVPATHWTKHVQRHHPDADAVLAVLPPPADRAAILAEVLPAWEAVYEPGNVSDYLIGYANDQDAATGMAEAWLRSQAEVSGRLEWEPWGTVTPLPSGYDQWFELIERHDDGIDTGPGIIVRRRMADETQLTQAHEPLHQWRVEILDGDEWMPSSGLRRDRSQAAHQMRMASEKRPLWNDGTPVHRRLVRETTTYTIEAEPAAGARQDGARS